MMTSSHALRAGFALPGRPASRGRRRVLGLLGALPALAALGACTPWGGGSGGDLTASACAEGATVPRPSTSWGEDSGDREIVVDDSVLSREAIAVSPDGALVAANTGIGLKRKGEAETAGTTLWNTTDGSLATRFDNELAGAIAWHPDGSLLALGGPEHIEITTVEGEVLWTLTGHTPPREGGRGRGVQDLAFSADGSTLVSLGADGTVRLWTGLGAACSPGEILDVRDLEPLALALAPDGTRLAVAGPAGPVELWDLASAKRIDTVEGTESLPREVAYAPDGTLLIGTGTALEHTASDPEHAQLFASGPDGDLQEAPALPGTDAGHVAVAPDGERVAVTSWTDSPVLLWDRAQDGLEELPRAPGAVGALTYSPDGTVLYGASSSEGVITWDGTDWTTFARP